jgi:hypothetical protein
MRAGLPRLDKRDALKFGAGTPRIARARRIASKCDHCIAYGDQACVSACPTGSLIEINAYDLFRERSPRMAELARAGFDGDLKKKDRKEVLPVMPFTEGLAVRTGGIAKMKRGRYAPLLMWVVGIFAFLVALGEILLRSYAKDMSYLYEQLSKTVDENGIGKYVGLAEDAILQDVKFTPGDQLSTWCGAIGTGLMIIAAIYPIFRRIKLFRWLASNTMWFDFHIMAGVVGPMFVGLHCALRLDSWVSAAFWSMVITVVSGFLGRYLYTHAGPGAREWRRARGARSRTRVPEGEADPDRPDGRDRPRALGATREGASRGDVTVGRPRAVVAGVPGRRPHSADLGPAQPARPARGGSPHTKRFGAARCAYDRDRASSGGRPQGAVAAALVEKSPRSVHHHPDWLRDSSHLPLLVPCALVSRHISRC